MRCEERDQDLLLLTHGALPPWRGGRARLHLWRCPRCRRRREELAAASLLLRKTLRAPRAAGVPLLTRPAPLPLARPGLIALALLTVLLVSLAIAGGMRHFAAARPSPPAAEAPCRPDLPNDRCR